MPYSNHEPQSVLEKSSYKLYYNGSITDQTIHNRGWTQLCLIKPSKKHTSSNSQQSQPSQHQHRKAPEVHRIERGAYKNIAPETAYIYIYIYTHITTSAIHNGINPYTSHVSLKLLNHRPAPYILQQKSVILNTRLAIFGRAVNKKCFVNETGTVQGTG